MKRRILFLSFALILVSTVSAFASPPDRVVDDTHISYTTEKIDFQVVTAFAVHSFDVLSMAGPTAVLSHSITHQPLMFYPGLHRNVYIFDYGLRWYYLKTHYYKHYINNTSSRITRYRSTHLLYKWPQN